MTELEKKVFEYLCKSEASALNMGYPMPSTFVSKALN